MQYTFFLLLMYMWGVSVPSFSFSADAPNDFLIVPGKRVGFITKDTIEADLIKFVPEEHAKKTAIYVRDGEGAMLCGTILYPNSSKELSIFWKSDSGFFHPEDSDKLELFQHKIEITCKAKPKSEFPSSIEIYGDENMESVWKFENGLGVGITLEQLLKINNAPVTFNICPCCGGGVVWDWHGGVLESLIDPRDVSLGVLDEKDRETLYPFTTGNDYEISSSNIPVKYHSRIKVSRISIIFNEQ